MATISSLGSGSGLDLSGLLTSLMQAEQIPLTQLQVKEATVQAKISAFGSLKSTLSALQINAAALVPGTGVSLTDKYLSTNASVADTTIASATATSSAVAGSYSLEVTSLAKNQRLVTPAYSGGSASTTIATGTLSIEFGTLNGGSYTADGTRTRTITIDSTNSTLGGLRDAINAADAGVTATIATGTSGAQLVLTSSSTGLSNVMRLSGLTGFDYDPAASTGTLSENTVLGGQSASNAAFALNGIAGTSTSNTVTGAIDGVTLTLTKQTTVGSPTTLTISKNKTASLTAALTTFIKSYNDANKSMTDLGAYNATTKTAATLQGNSTLRSTQNQLRSVLFSTTLGGTSAVQRLSDIGVSVGKDGSLSLDSTKFSKAVTADFTSVASLVSKAGTAFDNTIDTMISDSGTVTYATTSANRQAKLLEKQATALSSRLTAIEARYRAQFTSLDTLIAGMKQTSTYLTQQLANLPGTSSN